MGKTFYIVLMSISGIFGLITYFQNVVIQVQRVYTPLGQVGSPTLVLSCLFAGAVFGFGISKLFSMKMEGELYMDDGNF